MSITKKRLMQLAGLREDVNNPSPGSNAFRNPGDMAMVNQAKEIQDIFNDDEDTVPSDDIEEVEDELLSLDFD